MSIEVSQNKKKTAAAAATAVQHDFYIFPLLMCKPWFHIRAVNVIQAVNRFIAI